MVKLKSGMLVGSGLVAEALTLLYLTRADDLDRMAVAAAVLLPIFLVATGVLRMATRHTSAGGVGKAVAVPVSILCLIFVSSAPPAAFVHRLASDRQLLQPRSASDGTAERVFRMAREHGAGPALALLREEAASDPNLFLRGHHIAHQTGRLAIERADLDLSALADCTLEFASGCIHGMLERYFYARPRTASDSLVAFCRDLTAESRIGAKTLECSHGLGHGLAVRSSHEVAPALEDCGQLPSAIERRECSDGVFMEVTSHTLGHGHPGAGEHGRTPAGGEHAPADSDAPSVADDVRGPACESVPERYRESCWAYRYVAIHAAGDGSWEATAAGCREAGAAALVNACMFGVGKQLALEHFGEWEPLHRFCAALPESERGACVAGAVEHIIDYDWTSGRAEVFCETSPETLRPACLDHLERRLGFLAPREGPETEAAGT